LHKDAAPERKMMMVATRMWMYYRFPDAAEEVEMEANRGPGFSTSWQIVCQHIRIVYGSQSKQNRVFI